MGFFDDRKLNRLGQKAYSVHLSGNELLKRGKLADAKQKYDEALLLYDQAYQAGCRKTGILMANAILLMRGGDFVRAREMMQEAAKDKRIPEDQHYELRINYAVCLWRLGLLDKAIETARYAGKYTKNSSYYSTLGTFLVDQADQTGDFEELKAFLAEATDYDDSDAATLDNYGQMYLRMAAHAPDAAAAADLKKRAAEHFEMALKEKSSQVTTLYYLALLSREAGDPGRARELVDRAIVHSSSKICPVTIEMLRALKQELA